MKKFPERTFDTNLTYKEIIKKTHEIVQDRILCQCGHSILIPPQIDKKVCTWCGRYVFKNKKDEFKYRMKEVKK